MLILLIVVVGAYSYIALPREAAPDVPIPYIVVTSTYEGVSPEDVENAVTMKIEKKLSGIKGVKQITSSSAEGLSAIIIEFQPDVVVEDALQRVKDKVGQARGDLPTDNNFHEPMVDEINIADFPIMMINMSGPISPVTMKTIADDLKDAIERLPGVMSCNVLGALEPEIRLEIDPDRVAAYGLTIPEIMALIPAENVNVSAGGLETPGTKFNVRVPAEFSQRQRRKNGQDAGGSTTAPAAGEDIWASSLKDPDKIAYLQIAYRAGKPIYLSDVAKVRLTFKDREGYARVDGQPSITLSVQKRVGGNIIEISEGVKYVLREARKVVPAGLVFGITSDRSDEIRRMVSDLENHILSGLLLVLVVLLVFLGWRASLIVALAIPLSLMISFAVLQAMGYTLNMIVLFSLIMVLGMLVDDAIVVVENVVRHMQMGYGRVEAAMKGTSEVAWPVITSTATKIAAFAPMAFWPGMMGSFMKYLPITLVITLASSLLVAMVINPTICAVAGGRSFHRKGEPLLLRGYRAMMNLVMKHRATALSLSVMLLMAMVLVYTKFGHGIEFFPDSDPKQGVVNIRCPQGTNVKESDRLARIVEARVEKYRADRQGSKLKYVVANVGSSGAGNFFQGGMVSGPHQANINLIFPDFEERNRKSADIVADIRRDLADMAGAEIKVEKQKMGPPTGAAVTVRIMGKDFDELQRIADQAQRAIANVPGLVNLRSDYEAARPELAFHVDRWRAMMLGVNTAIVGNYLRTGVFGSKVGTYRQYNDEYDITVRLPISQRESIDDLLRLRVPNAQGMAVPLSSLGTMEYTGGFGTINRIDQKRCITLTGDAEGRLSQDVLADVMRLLAPIKMAQGYEIRYAGEKEEQDKAQSFLGKAFIIALLLIWLVLVCEFNTLSVPLIIMSTVLLSLVGVLVGLLAHSLPFGVIMTGVGVISLTGVVVANGIVLLDFVRQLQRRGLDVVSAAVQASTIRLRPVFLTAITAILGLLPMATGVSFDFRRFEWVTKSESSEWWANMAIAVIYGLSFATVLTLVIVPALYVSIYKLVSRFGLGGLKKEAMAAVTGLATNE